jgi:hypothetical protein
MEQRVGLHEELPLTVTAEESAESGEQRSVRGLQHWTGHLATEQGNPVAELDDFDGQVLVVVPDKTEQLEDSDEGEVEGGKGQGPVSLRGPSPRRSCSEHADGLLGTHRDRTG